MDTSSFFVSKRFLESADAPIFVKDINGVYRYCNKAFADCLGLKKEEIIGKTAYDIVPKNLADIYTARDQALFSSASHKDYKKDGINPIAHENDGIFNKSIIYNDKNEIAGFLCMVSLHKINLPHEVAEELQQLTHREIEVFNLLVKGQSVKAMARELHISTYTIADHLKIIYRKLGVHSKNEAIYKGLHLFMTYPQNFEENDMDHIDS